jgi:hypothetical protein
MTDSKLNILWPDAEFEALRADYDTVAIDLRETTGAQVRVVAEGYIGFQLLGSWDESVVESGSVASSGTTLDACVGLLSSRGVNTSPSGSPARNLGGWKQLTVRFGDGSELVVVAANLSAHRGEG